MIEASRLTYRYHPAAPASDLQDINLSIAVGEYVLLCGASGSGKSTLCRALNGLIPHFHGGRLEGQLVVAGLDVREQPVHELFAHVGLVFQNPEAQLFNSTVERELAFGLESLGLPARDIRQRIQWAAQVVGLDYLLGRRPTDLSGGEKQLVAIGAMLALQPAVLVLDEPYSNLDPATAARIREILRDINELGTTIILAEHRLHDIVADVSRMVVLHEGQIALDGPPREVLREDVARYGLTEPYPVSWGKAHDLPILPLSVDEALHFINNSQTVFEPLNERQRPTIIAGKPVIQVEDMWYHFDDEPVLKQATLEVRRGECLALVGANGAGKTTLIKHFNGLYKPKRGRVTVLGQDTQRAQTSTLARHVGLVFQNPNDQFFRRTVHEEIMAGPRAMGFSDPQWRDTLVSLFHLQPYLARSPYRLSEGEKKRVAFASALATRSEIIVLDEPTTGQDRHFREALHELLNELRSRDYTIVLVTHDLEFASAVANRWAVLADGQLIANGDSKAMMANKEVMSRASLQPTEEFRLNQALSKQV
jgi:energy-coupling factor transporter ATP-binding protein EcfA2